jgi:hypothetical protein
MTSISTPKFVEEVEIMIADKATKLFQTMAIVNLNMGNLTLEVNTLKKIFGYGGEGEISVTGGIG